MLITRECDYAVRIVRALSDGELLCVNEICKKEDLTAAFVYKILKKLEHAGIVKSYRGSRGGYTLLLPADQLTLLTVYQAVDPEFLLISCLNKEKPCSRNEVCNPCSVHCELSRIQEVLKRELSSKKMSKILKKY